MSTKKNEQVKVTRNTTVEQLKSILNANFDEVLKKDRALGDSIIYAAAQMKKDPKTVKKADLADLCKKVITLLGDSVKPAQTPQVVVENSSKPKLSAKGGSKKDNDTSKDSDTEDSEKSSKPTTKPKNVPEVITADSFPDKLTAGDVKYVLAHDITSMEELLKAFNEDEEFVFAFYWSKTQIKQFNYGSNLLPAPKEFADNLDLASTLYVSDEGKVAYALSMYTEVLYQIMPESFEEIDGIRYSMGIEFQLYRAAK